MTPDELGELLQQPEGERLEFIDHLPDRDRLLVTIAAFANTSGGTLVLGIDDQTRQPRGLNHPGTVLGHALEWVREGIAPPLAVEGEDVEFEPGRHVVVIHVPRGDEPPYIADGRVVERRADRVVPISSERLADAMVGPQLARVINEQSDRVERQTELIEELWSSVNRQRREGVLLGVATIILGYLLGAWNPLG